ncbi:MAG TPA: DnaJ family domain-containing protein [Candidatus Latescibacteria bacterium]|nr:DnaJ family domain-containing protein [Candidatus Latescibacterota bacterium]
MSKLRRRPDGKPEFRSLDQLLAEAAQDDVVQRLPGKGRPIDLGDYLHADPESRVANKLLADHNVIPQPLQDRREAEKLAELAEIDAAAALADLGARRCRVAELQEQLRDYWPQQVPVSEIFTPGQVPTWLASTAGANADDGDWQAVAVELAALVATHNRRRAVARRKVEEALTKAADIARRLNEQVSLSRTLPPGIQMTPVGVETRMQRFDDECPPLETVPVDLGDRLRQAVRAARPSWWRRLLR